MTILYKRKKPICDIYRYYGGKTRRLARENHRGRRYRANADREYQFNQGLTIRDTTYFFSRQNAPKSFNVGLMNDEWGQAM